MKDKKEEFLKRVNPISIVPDSIGWIKLNPFFEQCLPTIQIQFKTFGNAFLPTDSYPLKEAIRDNEVILRIDLNHKRDHIEKEFSSLLTDLLVEARPKLKAKPKNDRKYDLYLRVWDLKTGNGRKLTWKEIVEKIFPEDFRDPGPPGETVGQYDKRIQRQESDIRKVGNWFAEAKKLILGLTD